MSGIPRVVILGVPKSGKKTLFHGISCYLDFDYKKEPERLLQLSQKSVKCYDACVFTRYYKADIEICVVPGDGMNLQDEDINELFTEDTAGLIFVCSSYDKNAQNQFKLMNERIESICSTLEMKLIVCSHSDYHTTEIEGIVNKLKDWCTDNQFECIPCNLRLPYLSWNESEKIGVARVVEDMECVMWSSMNTSVKRSEERKMEQIVIMDNDEKDQCNCCHKSKSVDGIHLYTCSRCKIASYCSKECQVQDWKTHKQFCNQVSGVDEEKKKEEESKRLHEAETAITSAIPTPPRTKEEEDMDNFGKLLQEIRSVKQQANSLPDEERRRRAAEMAVKVMKELDLGGEEELNGIMEDLKKSCQCLLRRNTPKCRFIHIYRIRAPHASHSNVFGDQIS